MTDKIDEVREVRETTSTTTYNLPPNVTFHKHRDINKTIDTWLVLGTGPTAEEDWELVRRFPQSILNCCELVLINRAQCPAGVPYAHHHVTFHPELYHTLPLPSVCRTPRRHSNVAMPWTTDCWAIPSEYHVGGSAFLAAYIAGQLGMSRVILLGCPMVGGPEHTELLNQILDAPMPVWRYYRSLVKSMSGATREVFGAPTTLPE
jgi:hypothetical protein